MAGISGQASRVALVRISLDETSLCRRKETRSLDPKEWGLLIMAARPQFSLTIRG